LRADEYAMTYFGNVGSLGTAMTILHHPLSWRVPVISCLCAFVTGIGRSPALAQSALDTRSGQTRICGSLATEAVSRLVTEFKNPFPNLKIENERPPGFVFQIFPIEVTARAACA
jgi:hypothetical protein